MCGKTTNLQKVHELMRPQMKSDLVSVATETDRTIYFDFLPLKLGKIAGFDFVVRTFTVPGQPYYAETRKMVLQGADGVVFVADSQRYMLDQNKDSLMDLKRNMKLNGIDYHTIPLIMQYNKRDLPDLCTVEDLDAALNDRRVPVFQASAFRGTGVVETLKAVTLMVFKHVRDGGLASMTQPNRPVQAQVPQGAPAPVQAAGPAPAAFAAPPQTGAALPRPPASNAGRQAFAAPPQTQSRPAPAPAAAEWGPGPSTQNALATAVGQIVAHAHEGSSPMPSKDAIGLQEFQNMAVLHHKLTERVAQLEKELHRLAQEHADLKRVVGKKLL